ncbi:MAG: PaaI family thioesterase, partial [Deltaproteobacteria bacterium]|nr:PaaI family thioesterase [Deltaproteobacteria bacterium]
MRAFVQGRVPMPPIHHLFGLRPVEAGVGTCTFSTPASPWLQGAHGAYTGGIGALVADAALGGAVVTGAEPWQGAATSQLCLNFLRPGGPWSGRLTARGRLIHTTPTVGLSEVHVEDGEGRLLVHGTSRCFLQRLEPTETTEPDPSEVIAPTYETPDPYLRPVEGAIYPTSV